MSFEELIHWWQKNDFCVDSDVGDLIRGGDYDLSCCDCDWHDDGDDERVADDGNDDEKTWLHSSLIAVREQDNDRY